MWEYEAVKKFFALGFTGSSTLYDSSKAKDARFLLRDIVQGREILRDLVMKELRVRYRYARLGFFWAVIEPLALMLILTFVFSYVLADKAEFAQTDAARPFAVSLLCGLIFWQFLATSLTSSTQSLIDNHNLINKVRFPREVVPLATLSYPLVNLGLGFIILLVIHLAFGGGWSFAYLGFIPVFAIQFSIVLGLAFLFSCSNVYFRDVGYMVGVVVVFGFYASPIFYDLAFVTNSDGIPRWLISLYLLNPMAWLIDAYRTILFDHNFPAITSLLWPGLVAILSLISGGIVFKRFAPTLSDHL